MDTLESTEEIWKPIPGYETYHASTHGNIKNVVQRKIRKQTLSASGYKKLSLSDEKGIGKSFLVHRVIALTFIPNPDELPTVDHIDQNPANNNLSNLRWASSEQQARNKVNGRPKNAKHVRGIWMCRKDGERIRFFDSVKLAAEEMRPGHRTARGCITEVASGREKQHTVSNGNMMWVRLYVEKNGGSWYHSVTVEKEITSFRITAA